MSLAVNNKKFINIGFIAGLSLLAVYFVVLSIANSFSHAVEQFNQLWYWILLLVVGFGIQVGLYFYIRESIRLKQAKSPTAAVAASGTVSAGSMVACCLHHLTDVLPLLGLAAAAAFLSIYQLFFIIIGVLSNLIGIIIMLEIIQKHNLSEGFLKKVLIYNMNKVKKTAIGLSMALSALSFVLIGGFFENKELEASLVQQDILQPESFGTKNLEIKKDTRNNISFEVYPIDFNSAQPIKFEIKIDTHSGSLDFDLTKISVLEDNKGNKYQPLDWQGSAPGGHHRSGVLIFSKLDFPIELIKLIIKDIPNSPRVFEWELKNE